MKDATRLPTVMVREDVGPAQGESIAPALPGYRPRQKRTRMLHGTSQPHLTAAERLISKCKLSPQRTQGPANRCRAWPAVTPTSALEWWVRPVADAIGLSPTSLARSLEDCKTSALHVAPSSSSRDKCH